MEHFCLGEQPEPVEPLQYDDYGTMSVLEGKSLNVASSVESLEGGGGDKILSNELNYST